MRIEAGGRLVEQQKLGGVDQRAGDGEPASHAPRQRVDPIMCALCQFGELEQLSGSLRDIRLGQPEIAPVDLQVLQDAELGVEGIVLRYDPKPRADLAAVDGGIHAEHPQRAARDWRHAGKHPHCRRLAGAVGPEEPE